MEYQRIRFDASSFFVSFGIYFFAWSLCAGYDGFCLHFNLGPFELIVGNPFYMEDPAEIIYLDDHRDGPDDAA